MTDPLDALQAADEARTPGPWEVGVSYNFTRNADFIALCGTHVPTLLARLRAAEAVCQAMAPIFDEWDEWMAYRDDPELVPEDDTEVALLATFHALAKYREVAGVTDPLDALQAADGVIEDLAATLKPRGAVVTDLRVHCGICGARMTPAHRGPGGGDMFERHDCKEERDALVAEVERLREALREIETAAEARLRQILWLAATLNPEERS